MSTSIFKSKYLTASKNNSLISILLNNCKVRTRFNDIDIKELFFEAVKYFDLEMYVDIDKKILDEFVDSVNPVRLSNFPYKINIKKCYQYISNKK